MVEKTLSEPRVDTSIDFRAKVDVGRLDAGTYTFIARPRFYWGQLAIEGLIVPFLVLIVNGFVWMFLSGAVSQETVRKTSFHLLTISPSAVIAAWYLTKAFLRQFENLKYPPMKYVFHQARPSKGAQKYREEPCRSQPRYEVWFRGELKESGVATINNPVLCVHADYSSVSDMVSRTANIYLASGIHPDSLHENDPFREFHKTQYVLYERFYARERIQSCVNKIRELREFLELPLESDQDMDIVTDAAQEKIDKDTRKWEEKEAKKARRKAEREARR